MQVTFFSVWMTILWSSILVLLFYIARTKTPLLEVCSISGIIVLYLFCLIRMLFPIEFFWTEVVTAPQIYNKIYDFFSYKLNIGIELHIYEWLLVISLMGTVFIMFYTINQYIKVIRYFNDLETTTNKMVLDILKNISQNKKLDIVQTAVIQIPCCIGVFHKRILIPDKLYTEKELYYIIFHECSHLQNNDFLIKILINIMVAFFWWNPFAYLLKKDLNQSLEIRCDNLVVKRLNKQERCEYLEVMLNEFKYNSELPDSEKQKNMMLYLLENHSDKLIERFRLIADNRQHSVKIGKMYAWV